MDEEIFVFPLSLAQQRLWFLDRLVSGNPIYSLTSSVRLDGGLDVAALERAIQVVVDRHEILRTTFAEIDGEPVQVVAARYRVALARIDLSDLPRREAETTAREHASAEIKRPFDLTRGPLLRATLVTFAADEHVLLLSLHHIVTDGWSMGVLFRELTAAYASEVNIGSQSALPPLPVQYADFALWQREWVSGARLERTLAYWRTQLAGLGRVELPTDHPRPSIKSGRGATVLFEIPEDVTAAVHRVAAQEHATLFMTLLAAFVALLGRYTGEADIAIGSPIANRTRAELEELIGFFVNTLVLRVSLAGAPSFRTLLRRVKEVALGAYAHQDLPFEQLVEALQPQRDLSRNPLFDIAFQCEASSGSSLELPGVRLSSFDAPAETAKFDLSLGLWIFPQGIAGQFEYSTDLFDRATIERMALHFVRLLEAAVSEPDRPVTLLPLLTDAERRKILETWNATEAEFPERTVHALIDAQAACTPDAIAVWSGAQQLTYRELTRRANRLAHHLRAIGIDRDDVVAVLLDRSVNVIVAMLGVLKAGAAYLPIDPSTPRGRMTAVLEHAAAALTITHARLRPLLPVDVVSLDLDADAPALAKAPATPPTASDDPSQLAYVICTSGSTGAPKAVEVTHRSLANLISWHIRAYNVVPTDRGSQVAALDFDAAAWEVWPYLVAGAAVDVADEEVRRSPAALLEWFATREVTLAFVPTPLLEHMVHGPWPTGLRLRAVLTGGDVLHSHPDAAPPFPLFNHYGPTESTVVATAARVNTDHWNAVPPIGRPIANTEAYVLDAAGQPVPIGVAGELHLGGVGLARGYRGRPELTAAKFRPHPFRPAPARLYATGDHVHFLPDGQLEFLGRLDAQIKLHGFRIEPAEIEAVLRRHPAVADARVVRREDTPAQPRLVAYVIAQNGRPLPANDQLAALVRAQLPAYMVPDAYVWLPRLPLTAHGKLDWGALPQPSDSRPALATRFAEPCTNLERAIAEVWRDALQVTTVGIDDNFFDLGGRSLLLVRVQALLSARLAKAVAILELFRHPTVRALAAHLDARTRAAIAEPLVLATFQAEQIESTTGEST